MCDAAGTFLNVFRYLSLRLFSKPVQAYNRILQRVCTGCNVFLSSTTFLLPTALLQADEIAFEMLFTPLSFITVTA